jgi:membrane protease YdiL (CAAX protease family)
MLSYGVLSRDVQMGVSQMALEALGAIAPEMRETIRPYDRLSRNIAWSLGCFTFYFALPAIIVRRVLGHRLRDYGLSTENFFRHFWIYALLFVPVGCLVLVVASNPDFQQQYPFYKNPQGLVDFAVWEFFYALQFFSLEFFFRGFMLHGAKDRLGRFAIFAMVVPYTMIHFRKPLYETIGAMIAGSALGVLSLRTRSILGGFMIHVAVAISMDVAAVLMRT